MDRTYLVHTQLRCLLNALQYGIASKSIDSAWNGGFPYHTDLDPCVQVGRRGAFCAGLQYVPDISPANGKRVSISDIIDEAPQSTSYAISYSPDGAVNGKQATNPTVHVEGSSSFFHKENR